MCAALSDVLMSATIAIAQLSDLVRDLEASIAGLGDVLCTKDELGALDVLAARLADTSRTVQRKTGSEQAWTASAKLRSQAQATIASLIHDGKLERPAVFRRNILLVFAGPKGSSFDSDDVRARKAATRPRCERILKLSPDGLVAWAASYTPTSWAAGCMAKDIFECLVEDNEFKSAQNWPTVIQQTVQKLQTDESLQNSVGYGEFMSGESFMCGLCEE